MDQNQNVNNSQNYEIDNNLTSNNAVNNNIHLNVKQPQSVNQQNVGMNNQNLSNQSVTMQPGTQSINTFNNGTVNTFTQSVQSNINQSQVVNQPLVGGNNQIVNGNVSKKSNVGIIIGIILVVIIGIVIFLFIRKDTDNLNNSDLGENNYNVSTNDEIIENINKSFYEVNGVYSKDTLNISTQIESEKTEDYDYIEKYNMKWVSEGKAFGMYVPVIPNKTEFTNQFNDQQCDMESDVLSLRYFVYNQYQGVFSREAVEKQLQNSIGDYDETTFFKLNKYTDVVEENGIFGYAYSVKTYDSIMIRFWLDMEVNNSFSSNKYYLSSLLSLDIEDYDDAKPIIEELSVILDYDIINLIDQVI